MEIEAIRCVSQRPAMATWDEDKSMAGFERELFDAPGTFYLPPQSGLQPEIRRRMTWQGRTRPMARRTDGMPEGESTARAAIRRERRQVMWSDPFLLFRSRWRERRAEGAAILRYFRTLTGRTVSLYMRRV